MDNYTSFGTGYEYGTADDYKVFQDEDFSENIIAAEGIYKSLHLGKEVPQSLQRNNNVFVVGGTGCGKTRSVIEPNLMQMNANYVVTDPKGVTCKKLQPLLEANGYEVTVVDTTDFSKSAPINLFREIRSEDDITRFANALVECNGGQTCDVQDGAFWDNTERMLYQSTIGFLFDANDLIDPSTGKVTLGEVYLADADFTIKTRVFPDKEVNMAKMIDLIDMARAKEDNEDYISDLDVRMEALRSLKPNCYAIRQYDRFKSAAGKTLKSIIISCHARLTQYGGAAVRQSLDKRGYDIPSLASSRKQALFIITSDIDSTYSGYLNLLVMQILHTLVREANQRKNGELTRPVQLCLDELYSIGRIESLPRCCATVRSRNISLIMATQSLSQLDGLYGHASRKDIINNCDTLIYLGGGDIELREYMEKEIYPIVDEDFYEVGAGDCIVKTRNKLAFKANKYDQQDHPRYQEMRELLYAQEVRDNCERKRDRVSQDGRRVV